MVGILLKLIVCAGFIWCYDSSKQLANIKWYEQVVRYVYVVMFIDFNQYIRSELYILHPVVAYRAWKKTFEATYLPHTFVQG